MANRGKPSPQCSGFTQQDERCGNKARRGQTTCGRCRGKREGSSASQDRASLREVEAAAHEASSSWRDRPVAFKELDATLQAAGCGQPADRAPLVEITRGPDGTSFVLAANPTHEFGVVTSHPETAAVEITDPTAAGLPAEATVNGRHLRDALRDHNAAEQKSLTAADIQFPDGETSVSVGRSAADRAQPDIADELRLATAKKMLDAVAEPRWRQGTTARSFAAEGARIAACASKDKDRPIMTRVAVGEWNGVKRLVSTNGHMLAVTQENLPEGLPKETMLRASDLTAFEKTVNAHLGNRDAALGMSNGAVDGVDVHGFHVGQARFVTSDMSRHGEFANWKCLIPPDKESQTSIVTVPSSALESFDKKARVHKATDEAGRRVVDFSVTKEDGTVTRLDWSLPAVADFVAGNLPASGSGEGLLAAGEKVRYNAHLMRSTTAAVAPERGEVEMRRMDALKPLLIVPAGSPADPAMASRLALQMPLRIT